MIVDSSYLKVLYSTFNPKLVYRGDAHGTIEGWRYLGSHHVDLSEATIILAMNKITRILGWRFWPAVPVITSTAELAYLVNYLRMRSVRNLEHYVPKIRRKIGNRKRGTIRYAIDGIQKSVPPPIFARPLKDSVFSIISELWICRELVDKGYDVEFNPQSSGPDLYLNGRSVKLEVTRKIQRLGIQEYEKWIEAARKSPEESSIRVNLRVLSASLLLLLADKLGEELRQGDIVIIDVSSTLEGSMMLALRLLSRELRNLELSSAVDQALELVDKGKKAIVLYSRSREFSTSLCINAEHAMKFIDSVKEYAGSLISLRREHPHTAIKILSNLF